MDQRPKEGRVMANVATRLDLQPHTMDIHRHTSQDVTVSYEQGRHSSNT